MAIYDDATAERLQETYGLANSTLRVWKHRNKIPDRYLGPQKYELPPAASRAQVLKIAAYCQLDYIRRSGYDGLPSHRLRDMLRDNKHARFTQQEAKTCLKYLKNLVAAAQKLLQNPNIDSLRQFLEEPALRPVVFIQNDKLYNRIRQGVKSISPEEWAPILAKLPPLITI